ncbi:coagulase domain-containing protein [Staphylococcus lutrae]|uniref:Staphylocoagulase N-terminal subdomain 1 domain-containing protein n=1 Tax=Staphylococcus lutrae TaxID=155085 RepID=A0AAC9RU14_9STAP|nr:coagulase domain-containing protein [Staphylococcus lutrae]ARJ50825.1 hypothetical protein B5P37_05570 [Staphylococcus lutrae]PNZ39785.1 coagulase [Staphylococcus lutrae]
MRKKLFILMSGAILASHYATTGNASAIVSGEPNPYKSKALELKGDRNKSYTVKQYTDSLDDLIYRLSVKDYHRFDEPEFKAAYQKYQDKFLAENDAINRFLLEEKIINYRHKNNMEQREDIYGLTHHRYAAVYDALKQNKNDFEDEIKNVETKHTDLKTFTDEEQDKADEKVNELENKVLMLGQTFYRKTDERADLYNKLDLIMGGTENERELKKPVNQRMLNERLEDLETIIDEFFEDIDLARPKEIPTLTAENQNDHVLKQKLRNDAQNAKVNVSLRHPRAFKKDLPLKHDAIQPVSSTSPVKALEIESPPANEIEMPIFTEEIVEKPMSTFHQKERVDIQTPPIPASTKVPQRMAAPVENVETEVITESNWVDMEEISYYQHSGEMVGYSESDTSDFTERDKRAIRRNHVREAEWLVKQYVDTHKYQDRIAAQKKVNMLGEAHQKYFNKMIQRAYNGQ